MRGLRGASGAIKLHRVRLLENSAQRYAKPDQPWPGAASGRAAQERGRQSEPPGRVRCPTNLAANSRSLESVGAASAADGRLASRTDACRLAARIASPSTDSKLG